MGSSVMYQKKQTNKISIALNLDNDNVFVLNVFVL